MGAETCNNSALPERDVKKLDVPKETLGVFLLLAEYRGGRHRRVLRIENLCLGMSVGLQFQCKRLCDTGGRSGTLGMYPHNIPCNSYNEEQTDSRACDAAYT